MERASVAASPTETRIRNECVVNAASYVGGAVSPGEIVTIFGTAIGPVQPASATITKDRPADTTLAETRVLFDGVPSPLLYTSSGQVTAIVPKGVADKSAAVIQVEYRGARSQPVTLPVLKDHLGIFFSLDSSGYRQPAIVNEDGTLNSTANPAARGSIVTIYGTGGGETVQETADGAVVGNPPPRLKVPVEVAFDDTDFGSFRAEVLYSGAASGLVAGLLQVNVRVPDTLVAGTWSLFMDKPNGELATFSWISVR